MYELEAYQLRMNITFQERDGMGWDGMGARGNFHIVYPNLYPQLNKFTGIKL